MYNKAFLIYEMKLVSMLRVKDKHSRNMRQSFHVTLNMKEDKDHACRHRRK